MYVFELFPSPSAHAVITVVSNTQEILIRFLKMIMLFKHIGNILLRMSILVQFPKVIFLFKVRDKCWFAIGEHSVYMETADSEIVILLLLQKHAFSSFPRPI